jgi:outer membrane protein assembly factor BamB
VGLANQSLLLYTISGTPLWKFQGKSSIFSKPFVEDGLAWLDQGNEVVAISLSDGKIVHRFSTPGGAGTPFILNKTLFSASSKRLLYGFSL